MKAKEFVQQKVPNARAERQVTNGGKRYWLIRDGRATGYISSGDTESKAWSAAKKYILSEFQPSQHGTDKE